MSIFTFSHGMNRLDASLLNRIQEAVHFVEKNKSKIESIIDNKTQIEFGQTIPIFIVGFQRGPTPTGGTVNYQGFFQYAWKEVEHNPTTKRFEVKDNGRTSWGTGIHNPFVIPAYNMNENANDGDEVMASIDTDNASYPTGFFIQPALRGKTFTDFNASSGFWSDSNSPATFLTFLRDTDGQIVPYIDILNTHDGNC